MTITPFLWFDTQAEEAMTYYASVFEHSAVRAVHRAQGRVMSVEFELEGQPLMALNGGPQYPFTPAISLFVSCETQGDIDRLWERFIADGGVPNRCGWLNDKFGLSWQIIPSTLGILLGGGGDAARAGRVMSAMLQMDKLDIARLQEAYDGLAASA
jgi:predicted 3-demethylubiquinone-9 3-methyltransferase (glyoxalase superfamily)